MRIRLQGAELTCIERLAELYERGDSNWEGKDFQTLGLTRENSSQVLETMESIGVITTVIHESDCMFAFFRIHPDVLQYHRELLEERAKAKAEKRDIVEIVKLTLRQHPVTAWTFLAFVAVGGVLAFVNQVIIFLKNIRVID